MFRRFSVNFALLSIALDALCVWGGLAVATHLRPLLGFLPFAAAYPAVIPTPWAVYLIAALEWTLILQQFSLYDGRRNIRSFDEFSRLTLAGLLAMVALAGTLFLSYRDVSRWLFLSFVLLSYSSMLIWRIVVRGLMRRHSLSRIRQVLIIGAGIVGRDFEQQILAHSELSLQVCGFLDDDPQKRSVHADIIGTLDAAAQIVEQRHIADVVVALPPRAYKRMDRLVGELHRLPVRVWVIPDTFRLALHKAAIDDFAGIPMLDLRAPALSESQRLVKRAFDLAGVLLALPATLLIVAGCALAILLEDGRPVLFRQKRVGENGRIFSMLKLRSMRHTASDEGPPLIPAGQPGAWVHKDPHDPRVTRVGRFLRRASLDELPQIINVLKGDMSLVGPRPELPELVAHYEDWQRQRFAVPQGITGWWQVNGRSDKPMYLNTEDDLYYVQNYSLLLDCYILFKTVGAVVKGRGAF